MSIFHFTSKPTIDQAIITTVDPVVSLPALRYASPWPISEFHIKPGCLLGCKNDDEYSRVYDEPGYDNGTRVAHDSFPARVRIYGAGNGRYCGRLRGVTGMKPRPRATLT